MRVRALETGYDNQKVREQGEEFDMPEDSFADWFEPVDAADKARTDKLKAADKKRREDALKPKA